MICLGDKVKDSITGFSGIVVGITTWLYGCKTVGIQPQELKDGQPIEAKWIDDGRVIKIDDKPSEIPDDKPIKTGGPQITPKRGYTM